MKKNCYILFGSKTKEPKDLVQFFYEKLDLDFKERDSLYLGTYYKYEGIYADRITIELNLIDEDYKEYTHKEYKTLIYISYVKGKNADRLSRSKHLKNVIVNFLDDVDYLREDILSDNGQILDRVPQEKIDEINKNARKNFKNI